VIKKLMPLNIFTKTRQKDSNRSFLLFLQVDITHQLQSRN